MVVRADRGGSVKSTNARKPSNVVSTEEWIPLPPKEAAEEMQSKKLNIHAMFENHRPV